MTRLLFDGNYLFYSTELAAKIGRNEATFLQQAHYWMSVKGGKVVDGTKWFWKTYQQWSQELCLSVSTVRRVVSHLKQLGLISVERLAAKTYYQANWYTLNKEALETFVHFEHIEAPMIDNSNCSKRAAHNIDSTSDKTPHSLEGSRENPPIPSNTPNPQAPEIPSNSETPPKIFNEHKVNHESNIPVAGSINPKKRTSLENENREKFVWEIEVGRPYPVFLNWWADTKYKPQGGRWEADAYGCAYSEFYNNPSRTEVALYPQFLEYITTATQTCNQVQNSNGQAILPSCFVAKPEATQENTQVLMANIRTLVERGAAVLVPTKSATPTDAHQSFAEATGAAQIKKLPQLKKSVNLEEERRRFNYLHKQPEAQIALLNEWLVSHSQELRLEAAKMAMIKKFNFERDENGEVVAVMAAERPIPQKLSRPDS
ncbi:hypothetical protein CAL7716_042070 [Calothrix sp. PCC 7716]|nr:hypothetical protein CAL7716_042070 [Calothrix sp. PCC 7716]